MIPGDLERYRRAGREVLKGMEERKEGGGKRRLLIFMEESPDFVVIGRRDPLRRFEVISNKKTEVHYQEELDSIIRKVDCRPEGFDLYFGAKMLLATVLRGEFSRETREIVAGFYIHLRRNPAVRAQVSSAYASLIKFIVSRRSDTLNVFVINSDYMDIGYLSDLLDGEFSYLYYIDDEKGLRKSTPAGLKGRAEVNFKGWSSDPIEDARRVVSRKGFSSICSIYENPAYYDKGFSEVSGIFNLIRMETTYLFGIAEKVEKKAMDEVRYSSLSV